MMTSMTIFAVMGFSLYGMFSALTTMQTVSLGIQHFKNEGYLILERLEKEVSGATAKPVGVFPKDTPIIPGVLKETIQPQFVCLSPSASVITNPLFFSSGGAVEKVQQLYFCRNEYQFLSLPQSEKVLWSDVNFSERILYLGTSGQLKLGVRTEAITGTNRVDGVADNTDTGSGKATVLSPLGNGVGNVEYLFWGNSNKDWENYESPLLTPKNSPIREWDSTVAVAGVHEVNELPRAMKILLTMTYNPERDHRRNVDLNADKNQKLVFEKIVIFKHGE